jgi:hypothetical protein
VCELVTKENPGQTVLSVRRLRAFSVFHHIVVTENLEMIQQRTVLQSIHRYSSL